MRARVVVAMVALLLPPGAGAQRAPMPGNIGRAPTLPTLPPRQPEPIARQAAYQRMPLSVGSYPLVSFIQSPGFTNGLGVSSWSSFGAGTKAEYRLTRHASATLDLTSSFAGGPAMILTAELGTRFHPARTESRAHPFADLRAGYVSAYDRTLASAIGSQPSSGTARTTSGSRYSRGFGAIAGVGMDYDLSRTFSLTTEATVTRNQLAAHDFQDATGGRSFAMTAFRYSLGLRYNPGRLVMPQGAER